MKTSVYIYPNYNPKKDKSGNLYIKYFKDSFIAEPTIVVRDNFWQIGVASAFFNLRSNIFIFHWVDLIPFKKFGTIQFVIFQILLFVLKVLQKKIVWVLHNKRAHKASHKLVDKGMKIMAKNADLVITHSSEGVDFFKKNFSYNTKITYIPHPVYSSEIFSSKEIKWDYIIWGGIGKYKRVFEFLEFVKNNNELSQKKILIAGKCNNYEYLQKINSVLGKNITFINRFIPEYELQELIMQSKAILFTYSSDSVLSSGALIYSLNFNKRIIGPYSGNFKDLQGIVNCYLSFEDIEKISIEEVQDRILIEKYLKNNTWEKFSELIISSFN
jgi:hypothetical protein